MTKLNYILPDDDQNKITSENAGTRSYETMKYVDLKRLRLENVSAHET